MRPLFGRRRATAEKEFRMMEWTGIISCRTGSPWAALLHMVKKSGLDKWKPCRDYRFI